MDVSALGAALRSVYPEFGVDLSRRSATARPIWMVWLMWAIVALVLITVDVAVHMWLAHRQLDVLAGSVQSVIAQQAPEVQPPTVAALAAHIEALNKQQTPVQASLLDVMRTVSQKSVSKKIHLIEMTYADGNVRIRGNAPSYKEEEAFQNDLKAVFKDLEVEDTHPVDNNISFTIRLGVKP